MKRLKLSLKAYLYKILIVVIAVVVTTINLNKLAYSEENLLDNPPASGLVSENGLSSYTNEEFKKAPIRITVFSATWCTYCKELKEEFPKNIYGKYGKDTVAIRIWEIDSKEAIEYFQKFTDKNKIPQEIKSQIPFIFINEKVAYIGYSKEITKNILEDIEAILNGKEPINGGNLNLDKKSNYNVTAEENNLKNKIQNNLQNGEISQINLIQAGIKDSIKFISLILFSLLFSYFLNFSKKNKILIGVVYLASILIFNILISFHKIPELLNLKYVQTLKIGLYILLGIIVGELIINLLISSKNKSNSSNIVLKITHLFNNKVIVILSFLMGFFVMNSQVYSKGTYYLLIVNKMKLNEDLFYNFNIAIFYSLGLMLGNIVLIWIIKSALNILKVLKCNFKIKKYI